MAKRRTSKAKLAKIVEKIEVQRRRAARPTLPVNAHTGKSKSLKDVRERLDRKARERRDWAD
jgi:hypothetical protein